MAITTLNYKVEGSGPPLLLVHGLGVTFTIWQDLIPLLSPYYKLYMVELPGNGLSLALPEDAPYYPAAAAALEDLRQQLGLPAWNLLGYSLGSRVVQAYLEGWPERAGRVVFLCPALLKRPLALGIQLLARYDRRIPAAASWLLRGWRLRQLVLLLGFNGRPHAYADLWRAEIEKQPLETLKSMLRDMPGSGRAPFDLPECPTLFIWSDRDAISARPHPPRPIDCLVGGNHSAPMLAAPAVAERMLAFLK